MSSGCQRMYAEVALHPECNSILGTGHGHYRCRACHVTHMSGPESLWYVRVLSVGARYAYVRQGIWPPHVGDEAAPDEMFLRSNMSSIPAANPDAPVVMFASNRGRTVRNLQLHLFGHQECARTTLCTSS